MDRKNDEKSNKLLSNLTYAVKKNQSNELLSTLTCTTYS